eukprot:982747-Rhodomonas_salina.4
MSVTARTRRDRARLPAPGSTIRCVSTRHCIANAYHASTARLGQYRTSPPYARSVPDITSLPYSIRYASTGQRVATCI